MWFRKVLAFLRYFSVHGLKKIHIKNRLVALAKMHSGSGLQDLRIKTFRE